MESRRTFSPADARNVQVRSRECVAGTSAQHLIPPRRNWPGSPIEPRGHGGRYNASALGERFPEPHNMADPIRHSAADIFLMRAEQAAADADAATVENVRQRFRRAEAAWRRLAERAEQTERMRANEFARVRAALKPAREAPRQA